MTADTPHGLTEAELRSRLRPIVFDLGSRGPTEMVALDDVRPLLAAGAATHNNGLRAAVEALVDAREKEYAVARSIPGTTDPGPAVVSAAALRRVLADAAPAPTETTHLLHAFDRDSGICRCGSGPFTVPEWVDHYHTQESPTLTERTDR